MSRLRWAGKLGAATVLGSAMSIIACVGTARADGPWNATVATSTDYVYRGISQTYGGAALQAAVNYQAPQGWFTGVWFSNVDPYPFAGSAVELNVYAGFSWVVATDWTARASYTRYGYLRDPRRRRYEYGEFGVTVEYQDRLAATIAVQPDSVGYTTRGYASHRTTVAYELSGRWPLPLALSLNAGVGYYDLTRLAGSSYWAASTGMGWSRGRLAVDLTRFYADPTAYRLYDDATANGRWVLSANWRF